jgi:hypothetical protein
MPSPFLIVTRFSPQKLFRSFRYILYQLIPNSRATQVTAIAIKIARLHAFKLIIGARDIQEGNILKETIQQETFVDEDFCVVFELDMTSYPSIEQFVNNVQNATERVHAVLLYTNLQRESVEDEYGEIIRSRHGTELQLQVNVLSTAYLAIFFLPLLLETALAEGSPTHLEFVGCKRYDDRNYAVLANFWEQSILQHLNKYPEDHFQYQATKFLQMGVMYDSLLYNKSRPFQLFHEL